MQFIPTWFSLLIQWGHSAGNGVLFAWFPEGAPVTDLRQECQSTLEFDRRLLGTQVVAFFPEEEVLASHFSGLNLYFRFSEQVTGDEFSESAQGGDVVDVEEVSRTCFLAGVDFGEE